jgi:hypothetical protein
MTSIDKIALVFFVAPLILQLLVITGVTIQDLIQENRITSQHINQFL